MQAVGVERYRELWRSDIAVAREIERLARQHSAARGAGPFGPKLFLPAVCPEAG